MTIGNTAHLVSFVSCPDCCANLAELRTTVDALRRAKSASPRLRLQSALILRRRARALNAELEYAWACYHAAVASATLDRPKLASKLWDIADTIFQRLDCTYGQARVAHSRGRQAASVLDVAAACVQYEAALDLARGGQYTQLEAKVLQLLADLAEEIGDVEGALHHLEDLARISTCKAYVVALVNATRLAQYLRQTRKAQLLIVQALGALETLTQPARLLTVQALLMYSAVLLDNGDATSSLEAALNAHEAAEAAGASELSRAEARLMLAEACQTLDRSDQALTALLEVERALPCVSPSVELVKVRLRLARAFAACARPDPARVQLALAREETAELQLRSGIAGAFGGQILLAEVLSAQVAIEESVGDYAAALTLHREFHALDRDNFKRARAEYAQALSEQYAMEQENHLTKALQLVNTQLFEAANQDPLTGALNRRAFTHEAEQLIEPFRTVPYVGVNQRHPPGDTVALVLLDLDHFKRINDLYGHSAGDALLMQVVTICGKSLRDQDRIARWGGEEFILLLRGTDLGGGLRACERLRHDLQAYDWEAVHPGMRVTASFGIGAWAPHDLLGDTAFAHAITQVDEALYRAKQGGRDRAEVVAPQGRGEFN